MPLHGLRSRLTAQPQPTPGYAYHVTHGVRISSIKLTGLLPGKPGVQYKTNEVFFGTNLNSMYPAYGTTIVSPMTRKFGGVAFTYYQGVAVLRTTQAQLIQLKFIQINGNDWSGSNVPPTDLELFIDGVWQPLQTVELGRVHAFWRALYDATPWLRSNDAA